MTRPLPAPSLVYSPTQRRPPPSPWIDYSGGAAVAGGFAVLAPLAAGISLRSSGCGSEACGNDPSPGQAWSGLEGRTSSLLIFPSREERSFHGIRVTRLSCANVLRKVTLSLASSRRHRGGWAGGPPLNIPSI